MSLDQRGAWATQEETIYFNDISVATRQNGQTYYIHADHLNTPRVISDSTNTVIWRWDSAPFGETLPDEDPDNNGIAFTYNLRFPGQYYDQESGLHYNYFRDYDPATGRYVQSDPIGLGGGLNIYAYVGDNSINRVDPFGFASISAIKKALKIVHEKLGGSLPKGKSGKFDSPQRGDPKKGYRLDPPHDRDPSSPESRTHINWWDYTQGKRGKGGKSGAEPVDEGYVTIDILFGFLGIWGEALIPSVLVCSELDCDHDGFNDYNGEPIQAPQESIPCESK